MSQLQQRISCNVNNYSQLFHSFVDLSKFLSEFWRKSRVWITLICWNAFPAHCQQNRRWLSRQTFHALFAFLSASSTFLLRTDLTSRFLSGTRNSWHISQLLYTTVNHLVDISAALMGLLEEVFDMTQSGKSSLANDLLCTCLSVISLVGVQS